MFKKILLIIIFVAVLGRFIQLDYAPPHLSNDEIGAAYAAYSISKTLKDGSNDFLPLLWQSHGGYGSPLAIYIPIPSIVLLGNTDFAVRLPSAVLGTLTVILVGFLAFELTNNKNLSILTSFLLAVSPWHFSASRWALESNYALFFIVLGLYLFFWGLNRSKNWTIIISFLALALAAYSYYSEWVLAPLIVFFLIVFYSRKFKKNKSIYLGVLLFGILLTPLLFAFIRSFNSSRANSEFISHDVVLRKIMSEHTATFERLQIISKAIIDKYSAYNSLDYLFFNGAKILPKENPYQFGFFLPIFLIGYVWGLFKLKKYYGKNSGIVYTLLIISPIAASITEGELNNWRSLPQLLPVALITASGSLLIWGRIKEKILLKIITFGVLLMCLLYFFLVYFRHFPLQRATDYQYGFKQIALYVEEHYDEYEKIIVDPRFGDRNYYYIGVPSSYIPFYTNLDPRKVQEPTYLPNGIAFDKYEFRDINWQNEDIKKNYLYVTPYDMIPNAEYNLEEVYKVKLPNWKPAFSLYTQAR